MDEWSNLCRCCLSPNSEVSLHLDPKVKEKFHEVTTIEVQEEDGLPQKLCNECYNVLNSAYLFRKQCLKMEHELRLQLDTAIRQTMSEKHSVAEGKIHIKDYNTDNSADDPMKQLEAIVKMEPSDNDEDFYLFLVINEKDKEVKEESEEKKACPNTTPIKLEQNEEMLNQNNDNIDRDSENFENSIDSFLVSGKVPVNVPATILENEEDNQGIEGYEIMQDESSQNNNSNNMGLQFSETGDLDSQEKMQEGSKSHETDVGIIDTGTDKLFEDVKSNFIKIISTTDNQGTILLKNNDNVTYLSDTQLVTSDGETVSQEEVIFCEAADDASQFQILKCDGSELVIEYADESQIATVLQQEDGTFLCDCGEQFDDLSEYEKHQYIHNTVAEQEYEHICNLCGKGFESAEILTGHNLLHKVTEYLIMCPFCNQLIKRNALTQHIKYGHNNIKPRCKICLKTFANPNNLKRHMMIHSDTREFECDICFKRFRQKITMQTHRITHMDPLACDKCGKSFPNKVELIAHSESDTCLQAKVTKVTEELVKKFKQEVTTSEGQLIGYACSLCKKMFSAELAFEKHVESVHVVIDDPMNLLCQECGEILPSKKEMQMHMVTHKSQKIKNSKRFECSICGKSCASQAMLIMHERVHTNERPFPCGLCSLRFKTKTHLRTHQLTHTREKKFGCSVCLKFFALKGNLVVHLRTHTGERPYVCSICGDAFIDSKYLKKHKLKKHAIDNVPWNKYYKSSPINLKR